MSLNDDLILACWGGDRAEVIRLLDEGADPNSADYLGNVLVHTILGSDPDPNRYEIWCLLLEHGADPSSVTQRGSTALREAIEKGLLDFYVAGTDKNIVR